MFSSAFSQDCDTLYPLQTKPIQSVAVITGVCVASPDKSSRRGGSGPECRTAPLWPASAGQAPTSPEPVAADKGRRRSHSQPGPVPGQSRAAERTRGDTAYRPATATCSPRHRSDCEFIVYFLTYLVIIAIVIIIKCTFI